MPRVTKSITAKSKHKKVLKSTKGHYGLEADYLRLQQSNIKSYNMPLEIEKIAREVLDLYGFQESMLVQGN